MQRSSTVRKRLTPDQREKILGDYHRKRAAPTGFRPSGGHQRIGTATVASKAPAALGTPPGSFIAVPNLLALYRLHPGGRMMLEIGPGFRSEELAALLALLPALCSR